MLEITTDPHKLKLVAQSALFVILLIPCIFVIIFRKEFIMASQKLFKPNLEINRSSLFVLKYGIILPISLLVTFIITLIMYLLTRV